MSHKATVPERYHGKMVGDGHCVALVREVTGLPPTSRWRRGARVRGADPPVESGTAIATFFGDPPRYTSRTDGTAHAAIFLAETEQGLLVWDQWLNQPVHQRTIRFRGGGNPSNAVNDGDMFFVIELEEAA